MEEKGGSSRAKAPSETGLSGVEVDMPKGAQGPERSSRFVSSPQGTCNPRMAANLGVPRGHGSQGKLEAAKNVLGPR